MPTTGQPSRPSPTQPPRSFSAGTIWDTGVTNGVLIHQCAGPSRRNDKHRYQLLDRCPLALVNGPLPLSEGGSITVAAASSTLLANNNTFSGTNVFTGNTTFTNASTTNISASGTGYFTNASTTKPHHQQLHQQRSRSELHALPQRLTRGISRHAAVICHADLRHSRDLRTPPLPIWQRTPSPASP